MWVKITGGVISGGIKERGTGYKTMSKAKTGTENGFRVVRDGTWEPMRQHIEVKSRMFQFDQTKGRGKGRNRKKSRKRR